MQLFLFQNFYLSSALKYEANDQKLGSSGK